VTRLFSLVAVVLLAAPLSAQDDTSDIQAEIIARQAAVIAQQQVVIDGLRAEIAALKQPIAAAGDCGQAASQAQTTGGRLRLFGRLRGRLGACQ
jgi:hypothetical protein